MKKQIITAALTMGLALTATATSYAGKWQHNAVGWWYDNEDGTWQNNGWFQDVDGKYYYFTPAGYMLANTKTPDGYYVDASGAWMNTSVGKGSGNTIKLKNFTGVYDIQNVTGPGCMMLITEASNDRIAGAYATIYDGSSAPGFYSEFDVPVVNDSFTISGYEVKMIGGEDGWEYYGNEGIVGTFEKTFKLKYVDDKPAIVDAEYDTHHIYLGRVGSEDSKYGDCFWDFYDMVRD